MAKPIKPIKPIKANRIFTPIRKYSWIFTIAVAFGGLWYPKLGLLVIGVMVSLAVLGFFNGRYWCGNICSHGSLYDKLLLPVSSNKEINNFFKNKYTRGIVFIVFMVMFSRGVLNAFSHYDSASLLDQLGYVFVISYLVVTLVGVVTAVIVSPRTWCNFCPMGTMQVLMYRLGKLVKLNNKTDKKVTVQEDKCLSCGKCSRVCPMQLTPHQQFDDNGQYNDENCIKCAVCVNHCPTGVLSISTTSK